MAYFQNKGGRFRTPAFKLFKVGFVAFCLIIPLLMIYALVYDRQDQSETAQFSIASGWGGPQTISGPVIVIPYTSETVEQVNQDGKTVSRTVTTTKELYLSPDKHNLKTIISPRIKKRSIYESILFEAENKGSATFNIPPDFARYGIAFDKLKLDNMELRFGVLDARGLQSDSQVTVNGKSLSLKPGKGLNATKGSGFFAFIDWDAASPLALEYSYSIRGNKSLRLIPRAIETSWDVTSTWPHPSFTGDFLPTQSDVKKDGFTSSHNISNLALGQDIVLQEDPGAPVEFTTEDRYYEPEANPNISQSAVISMIEPVDLYSQVDRATKYGFMFIGFTFLALLMFDIVGGTRISAAEYLLTGTGLILFFIMLLAFAELIGFLWAYLAAAAAIIALLTAYSAAILKSWKRATFVGGLLLGLYATLYVLLNLEGLSLIFGSIMLFIALAVLMWITRSVNWSSVDDDGEDSVENIATEVSEQDKKRPIATVT